MVVIHDCCVLSNVDEEDPPPPSRGEGLEEPVDPRCPVCRLLLGAVASAAYVTVVMVTVLKDEEEKNDMSFFSSSLPVRPCGIVVHRQGPLLRRLDHTARPWQASNTLSPFSQPIRSGSSVVAISTSFLLQRI